MAYKIPGAEVVPVTPVGDKIVSISGISLVESDGMVLMHCAPAPDRPPLDGVGLQDLLAQAGFGAWQCDEAALQKALDGCNTQQPSFSAIIARRVDALVDVQVDTDEMQAHISITPAFGGKAANLDDLNKALADAGVVSGMDTAALTQACTSGQCSQLLVAQGVPAQKGNDTVFEELIAHTVNRAPVVNEYGLIDYREHGGVTVVVHAGQALMRRIPPTAGVAGCTVKGRSLQALAGRDEAFAADLPGTQLSDADANVLLATVGGQPVRVPHGITVESVLRVKEVNMATGNIHFDGTVEIDGEVVQGMVVHATGDILVAGMVDGGVLESGGDIRVTGGVIAHAKLRAKGSVSARFAQSSAIEAGTVIALADMAMECDLHSLNQIVIGAEAPQRGRLSGGTTTAMMQLKVPLLGSSKAGVTSVVMGVNAELNEKLAALNQRIAKEKATEEGLQKLVHQMAATGDPKHMLGRVKASWQHAVQVWGKSLVEHHALEAELAQGNSARIEVGLGVEGAVDVAIGKHIGRLRRECSDGVISLDVTQQQVVLTNSAGASAPLA